MACLIGNLTKALTGEADSSSKQTCNIERGMHRKDTDEEDFDDSNYPIR